MKICYLASANSVHSHRWISFFVKQGHEVIWISTDRNTGPALSGIDYHEIHIPGPKALSLAGAVPLVRRIVHRARPDVLHAHFASSYGLLGALAGWQPFVVTAWGSDVLRCRKSRLRRYVVRYVLDAAVEITCDAEHMRMAMSEIGVDPGRIKIIYFGTDTQEYHSSKRSDTLRNELGLGGAPAVISVRSLAPLYNVETLVRAVPFVLQRESSALFVIVGGGPEAGRLKGIADSLGVSGQIRFVGAIQSSQMAQYLASADVYVSTSLQDAGLASSTAEAMACSLPVVVTDSGENRLWVEDGQNGFVVPVRDPATLADRLITLLQSSELRGKFGENARMTIDDRDNYAKEMKKIENLYQYLSNSRGVRP